MQKQHHSQKTPQKPGPSLNAGSQPSTTATNTATTSEWVHESVAAEHLALTKSTLRTMRRDGRLDPGEHFLYSTGTAGGPVIYDLAAIKRTLVERTKEFVRLEAKRKAQAERRRMAAVESFDEAGLDRIVAEIQS